MRGASPRFPGFLLKIAGTPAGFWLRPGSSICAPSVPNLGFCPVRISMQDGPEQSRIGRARVSARDYADFAPDGLNRRSHWLATPHLAACSQGYRDPHGRYRREANDTHSSKTAAITNPMAAGKAERQCFIAGRAIVAHRLQRDAARERNARTGESRGARLWLALRASGKRCWTIGSGVCLLKSWQAVGSGTERPRSEALGDYGQRNHGTTERKPVLRISRFISQGNFD